MPTQLDKDFEQIEAFLASPSPLGEFQRKDEPLYQMYVREVEYTGKVLAKAEYVKTMREIEHFLATYLLKCFVQGVEPDKEKVDMIKEKIEVFTEELKKGVWS